MAIATTPGLYEWDGSVLWPLSVVGSKQADGSFRALDDPYEFVPVNQPPHPPPPTSPMLMGVSGGQTTLATAQQFDTELHSRMQYLYWTGAHPHDYEWAEWPALFPNHSFSIAVSLTDLAACRTMLSKFPATWPQKVYVSFKQEPDNDFPYRQGSTKPYTFHGDIYVADSAPLMQAMDEAIAAGKTYLVKSISLLFQTLVMTDGTADTFIGHGQTHLMSSMYASTQVKGDATQPPPASWTVAAADPQIRPQRIGDWAKARGMTWGAAATGFSLLQAYWTDPVSVQNRVNWMTQSARAARDHGSTDYGWFNSGPYDIKGKGLGDYTIQNDAALKAAWDQLLAEMGQYP